MKVGTLKAPACLCVCMNCRLSFRLQELETRPDGRDSMGGGGGGILLFCVRL